MTVRAGRFIKRVHQCPHPSSWDSTIGVGSVWECACGQRWELMRGRSGVPRWVRLVGTERQDT